MEGDHRYCACFTFYEKCNSAKSKSKAVKSPSREALKDGSQSDSSLSDKRFSDGVPGISVNAEELSVAEVFAPKCLCLVSRASYFDILKVRVNHILRWKFSKKTYSPTCIKRPCIKRSPSI